MSLPTSGGISKPRYMIIPTDLFHSQRFWIHSWLYIWLTPRFTGCKRLEKPRLLPLKDGSLEQVTFLILISSYPNNASKDHRSDSECILEVSTKILDFGLGRVVAVTSEFKTYVRGDNLRP